MICIYIYILDLYIDIYIDIQILFFELNRCLNFSLLASEAELDILNSPAR